LPGCKYEQLLRFDFVVFNEQQPKVAIEFDGKQHFEVVES
jgi:very-short-patch-repair endonuclease